MNRRRSAGGSRSRRLPTGCSLAVIPPRLYRRHNEGPWNVRGRALGRPRCDETSAHVRSGAMCAPQTRVDSSRTDRAAAATVDPVLARGQVLCGRRSRRRVRTANRSVAALRCVRGAAWAGRAHDCRSRRVSGTAATSAAAWCDGPPTGHQDRYHRRHLPDTRRRSRCPCRRSARSAATGTPVSRRQGRRCDYRLSGQTSG